MQTVATNQSVEFVKENLADKQVKILEICFGKSVLREALNASGFQVTSLESPEEVLEFTAEVPYDAALFSCSLHHAVQLEKVLAKVKTLLNSTGKLLVEDFAKEQMDAKTAGWFYPIYDLMSTLAGQDTDIVVAKAGETEMERWMRQQEGKLPVHSAKEMAKAIEKNFGTCSTLVAPYLYRYCLETCETLPNAHQAAQKVFEWESKLIEKGAIAPIGFRIVAKQYFSYLR